MNGQTATKILEELYKEDKIAPIYENFTTFEIVSKIVVPPNRISEAHLVAILFNNANEIFCAKRSSEKPNFPDKWEFGCAQLKAGKEKIDELLKHEYKKDFNIHIESIAGESDAPIVIATYGFEDSSSKRWIPGFIFTGRGKANGDLSWDPKKHSETKWLPINDALKFDDNDAVKDFKTNIKKAVQILSILIP